MTTRGETLGTISGLASCIETEARLALEMGPRHYREALQRILAMAGRAEQAWSDYSADAT
jgi:hypothetical protein